MAALKQVRRGITLAALALAAPTIAAAQDVQAQRQSAIAFVLQSASPETVTRIRGNCALGQALAHVARVRATGAAGQPDATEECVAALTRLGRDGTLGFIRDTQSAAMTPALAFDTGFVTAYRRREPIPSSLPSMAALKPIAQRCLAQAERDVALCRSAGYAYGTRAARGENVTAY